MQIIILKVHGAYAKISVLVCILVTDKENKTNATRDPVKQGWVVVTYFAEIV